MFSKSEQEIMQSWQSDNTKPIVSVCCITYNHENFISESIDSFLMQETDFAFEIVVGEDCSTDETRKYLEKYLEKYPNIIKLITSADNVGMNENFIRTMKACNGEYIALCEGDDYWTDENKLQIQLDEMKKHPNIGISFHLAATKRENETLNPVLKDCGKIYTLKEVICGDFHLVQSNTIIFRNEYLNNLDFDLFSKSPVGDVWLRISCSIPNGALFINKIMSVYRMQSEGSWSQSIQKSESFMIFVNKMMKSIDDFDEHWKHKYTNEFKFYKNMYISVVIKKDIVKLQKNDFIEKHSDVISLKNKLLWDLLYRHEALVKFLKKIKQMIRG